VRVNVTLLSRVKTKQLFLSGHAAEKLAVYAIFLASYQKIIQENYVGTRPKKNHHGLCDSNKLLYKRCAKTMEKPKIRPPIASTFFNRSFWNSKTSKTPGIRPRAQNLVDVGRRKRGLRKWQILAYFCFFLFLYSASRPDHTVGPITTNEGSKRVFVRKEVPFGDLGDKKIKSNGQNSLKHDFLGLNKHFKPNLLNFQIAISRKV